MNAHLTHQELNAYIHQTLNDAQRETLDAHLANCPVCRSRLSELDVLQQRVRRELGAELKAVNVPLSLTFEAIAPKLQPQSRAMRLWHHSRQALLGLTAIAAVLMVVIVLANTASPTADQIGGRLISNAGRVGGWYIDGDDPASYEFGIDQSVAYTGQASGFIRSKADVPKGIGALMQGTPADSYRGKRIRLSAYIKTEEVERQAGLWLRINRSQIQTLSFADLNNRPIQGTTDWQKYDLVLDVPNEATSIGFAFFLMGRGQVWVDDVQLEIVGQEVATTETKEDPPLAQPTNLDFEAGLAGWLPERNPQNYTTSTDTVNVHGGQASAHIQSKANPISSAVLVQSIKAVAYRGKRLQVTAYINFEQIHATAQFVAGTIDSQNIKQQDIKKRIYSTPLWQKQSLVFEVPWNSDQIAFGVILQGEGQIWIDDVQVEVVGTDTVLTISDQEPSTAAQPGVTTGQDLDQSFSDWVIAGTRPQDYEMGFDSEVVHTGKSSAYVKSMAATAPEFGTFMTMVNAANYRGKRVRLAAQVKAEQVEGQARLWLRVDGPESTVLGFDNMQNRPIQGTHDWQKYEVVLDVPENSVDLAYGILLAGKGQVWLDNVQLQVVDQSVSITGYETKPPADLGFEIQDQSWAAPQESTTPTPAPTTQAMISTTATPPAMEDTSAITFGDVANLVNSHLVQEKFLPGETVPLALDWTILIKPNQTYTSFAHVLDSQSNVVAQVDLPLQVAALIDSIPAQTGWNTPGGHVTLPIDLPAGQYTVTVGIYNNQSGQHLTTGHGETTATIGTIEVVAPLARFGNSVILANTKLPATQPAAGEAFELSLHWIVPATQPALNTFVHVIDSQGNIIAQSDQSLAPAETSIQTSTLQIFGREMGFSQKEVAGTSIQTITLQLPNAMAAGDYQIVVGVYDTTTLARLTTDQGDTQIFLTSFEVGSKSSESADTSHLHLVFAPEDRASAVRAAAQLEESFKQVCADLGCETSEPTCTTALDQEWCSPYSPSLTMTVFVRGTFEPMVWRIDHQLTLQVPSPRVSPLYAEGQRGILGRVSDLSPFVEKVAWPTFIQEPHSRGGTILYTAIVQWETHRLAQRLGQTSMPNPFRPDRLTTYPARPLDTLWNTSEIVSIDLRTQDESVALITFIVEKYGDQAVTKLLRSIGNAPSLSHAVETSLGVQYADFEQSWYDWLKQYSAN